MTNRKKSQQQEKSVAKQLSGRVIIASGATDFAKGDVRTDVFLIECKTTARSSYILHITAWEKIMYEALKGRLRIPLMCVDIQDKRCYICETALCGDLLLTHEYAPLYASAFPLSNRQYMICGDPQIIIYSADKKRYELAVVPKNLFESYVLKGILT
jgi:hypothetical protein